jgi:hypothetical protein
MSTKRAKVERTVTTRQSSRHRSEEQTERLRQVREIVVREARERGKRREDTLSEQKRLPLNDGSAPSEEQTERLRQVREIRLREAREREKHLEDTLAEQKKHLEDTLAEQKRLLEEQQQLTKQCQAALLYESAQHHQAAYESASTVVDVARGKLHEHFRIATEHKKLMQQHDLHRKALGGFGADVSTHLAKLSELAYEATRALYQESFDDLMRHKRVCENAQDEKMRHKRLLPQFAKFDARMSCREKLFAKRATGLRDRPDLDAMQWLNSSRSWPC